jgi:hypothetical protein
MESRLRKGGLVQNTQNGSYHNQVCCIILKPWTVKYNTFLNDKQSSTFWPFCATNRQCRTHTICSEWLYTHTLVRCTAVNIEFSIHCISRNCWKHFLLVCRHMSHPTNTFFIAHPSAHGTESNTFRVMSSSPSRSPLRYHFTGAQNSVLFHDLSLDLWTTVIVWCDQFPDLSSDDTTATSKNF